MSDRAFAICAGNIEIWDQTVGCPECGDELWNYPGIDELGLTVEQYEERFWQRHPFAFSQAHDDGDEDPRAWDRDDPVGGVLAWFNRYRFGNAIERYHR